MVGSERNYIVEKPDAICGCGERIFWWPLSQFWSHASGPNAGLRNCFGVHNPSKGIINPGPFAAPDKEGTKG